MDDRPEDVVIFGLGAHGRSAYRALRRQHMNYCVTGFFDNDPTKQGATFADVPILSAEDLLKADFDKIVIAGRWIEGMTKQLVEELGIPSQKIMPLSRSELAASSEEITIRSKDTDEILAFVTGLLVDLGVSYWIDGSSLLALFRGADLSEFSDVDVTIKDFKGLVRVREALEKTDYLLEPVGYSQNTAVTDQGRFYKLVVSSRADVVESEPACVDIMVKVAHGDVYLMPYGSRFLYTPKAQFDGFDPVSYHGITLRVPREAESYLRLVYGENWTEPAPYWSSEDYGNLVDV